jgi:hypothetical protein
MRKKGEREIRYAVLEVIMRKSNPERKGGNRSPDPLTTRLCTRGLIVFGTVCSTVRKWFRIHTDVPDSPSCYTASILP